MFRSHNCGALRSSDVGQAVTLCGWVTNPKHHGGLVFVYLRDRYGITQLVISSGEKAFEMASQLRREDVIQVKGVVRKRPDAMVNKDLATGEVEVVVSSIKMLGKAEQLPIEIEGGVNTSEEMRLKYRYLDLRRPQMMQNLLLRSRVVQAAREYFVEQGFLEVETPLFVKSTPEGARDYVVPSRVNPGTFFALPQSPQLYKQILMIAGVDRYFQVARCLRDEDLRADRQPEHTQFDFEMSFVTSDEIRAFVEGLMRHVFKKVKNLSLKPFQVFSYHESMSRFGSDKPDLRFDLELVEVTDLVRSSEFSAFSSAEYVGCLVTKEFSRKEVDELTALCKRAGAQGLATAKIVGGALEGGVSKFLSVAVQKGLLARTTAKEGMLLFVADKGLKAKKVLGVLRSAVAQEMGLLKGKEGEFLFCWVKDYPLFSYNEEESRWEPEHHMFSMPKEEFVEDFEKRPGQVIGDLWDLVLNGTELASGSIRVSNPIVQERIMNFIGFDHQEAQEKFGFLLEAYRYGAPVHGGMGLGADRIVALMAGTNDIREVIAFPRNKNAQNPMDGSPSTISDKQLDELGVSVRKG